jgi:Phosphopantetheine attachment site
MMPRFLGTGGPFCRVFSLPSDSYGFGGWLSGPDTRPASSLFHLLLSGLLPHPTICFFSINLSRSGTTWQPEDCGGRTPRTSFGLGTFAALVGWLNVTLAPLTFQIYRCNSISPYPYPVQWWEFIIVVVIVIAFSVVMEAYVNELLVRNFIAAVRWTTGSGMRRRSKEGESVLSVVQSIIRELTFAEVTPKTSLAEAGLSSMTTVIFVSEIKKVYKTLKLTTRDVSQSETVTELVDVIDGRMLESATRPELALGKRTAVGAPKAMKKTRQESLQGSVPGGGNAGGSVDDDRFGSFRSSNPGFSIKSGMYQTFTFTCCLSVPLVTACNYSFCVLLSRCRCRGKQRDKKKLYGKHKEQTCLVCVGRKNWVQRGQGS